MGQVQWQRSRSAFSPADGRLPGRLRPPWDGGLIATDSTAIPVAVPLTGGRVQEIRMFFVFIDFQRKSPPLP
jgi:hypothetical protein